MNRSAFLKNKDLTAGLVFCNKCGTKIENSACGPCEVEALNKMSQNSASSPARIPRPGTYRFANVTDPNTPLSNANISGIYIYGPYGSSTTISG